MLKEQGSKQNVRSLLTATAVAGLTYGIAHQLGISQLPNAPLNDSVQKTAVQTAVSTSLALGTGEKNVGEIAVQGVRGIVTSVAGAGMSNQIKDWYTDGILNFITHKLAHAGAGAVEGAIFSKDSAKGAAAGAIGAFVAETVGDSLPQSMDINTRRNIALLTAATTAFLLGEDVNTAILAATIAIENNMCFSSREEELAGQEMWSALTEKVIIPAVTTESPLWVDVKETMVTQTTALYAETTQALQKQDLTWWQRMALKRQHAVEFEAMGHAQSITTTYFGKALEGVSLAPVGFVGKGLQSGAQLPQFMRQIGNFFKFERQIEKPVILALKAPKMADHHIFPQQFRKFFGQKGITIDKFTVSVGETTHLKGLHGSGNAGLPGKWNQKWLRFIEENPNASAREIYQFGGKLMDQYKLNNLTIHGYKK